MTAKAFFFYVPTLLFRAPLVLEILGLFIGIFLPRLFNAVAQYTSSNAEPLHHDVLADFLSGLIIAICFHTLKSNHKSSEQISKLTQDVSELIASSIEKSLTRDIDASLIKVLSQTSMNDPLLAKLHANVFREYFAFFHSLSKNIQPIVAAISLLHVREFLNKISDQVGSGVSLTHKQQGEITEILTEGRKAYKLFEFFIGTHPDTWNKTFLRFVDGISNRKDIAKEYTVIAGEAELTDAKLQILRACFSFYKKRNFAVYICSGDQVLKAIDELSFRYNVLEIYGSVGCSIELPDLDYGSTKKFECSYWDLDNRPHEKDVLNLVLNFRESMEAFLKKRSRASG
jgi:hypothetical protein